MTFVNSPLDCHRLVVACSTVLRTRLYSFLGSFVKKKKIAREESSRSSTFLQSPIFVAPHSWVISAAIICSKRQQSFLRGFFIPTERRRGEACVESYIPLMDTPDYFA